MSTLEQISANQANAQLSTGPRTDEGKRSSSLNAVKTGLTGRTVVLPTEDMEAYRAHVARVEAKYRPATDEEQTLVHSIADGEWRLLRIPSLESGIYALGRVQFAAEFANQPEDLRATLIDAKTYLTYGSRLDNLLLQQGRITRKLEADRATLAKLQEPRRRERSGQLAEASWTYLHDPERRYDLAYWRAFGFDFTAEEWIDRLVINESSRRPGNNKEIQKIGILKEFAGRH